MLLPLLLLLLVLLLLVLHPLLLLLLLLLLPLLLLLLLSLRDISIYVNRLLILILSLLLLLLLLLSPNWRRNQGPIYNYNWPILVWFHYGPRFIRLCNDSVYLRFVLLVACKGNDNAGITLRSAHQNNTSFLTDKRKVIYFALYHLASTRLYANIRRR